MDLVEKVKNWLVDEGIYKDRIPDDTAKVHFLAEIPPNSQQMIDIIFPKNREDMIIIGSGIKLADEHYKALMTLKKEKREEILWEMRFTLLFLETGFQILPSAEDPQIFNFTREIYADGLNKNLFMDAIKQVHRCKLYVVWMMQKLFGKVKSENYMYR
ncbi:MAG: DUF2299 family protein [Archaeoglobales archaeon]|nr:DUF2299 family protein [Archaeoglobales archaeon]